MKGEVHGWKKKVKINLYLSLVFPCAQERTNFCLRINVRNFLFSRGGEMKCADEEEKNGRNYIFPCFRAERNKKKSAKEFIFLSIEQF